MRWTFDISGLTSGHDTLKFTEVQKDEAEAAFNKLLGDGCTIATRSPGEVAYLATPKITRFEDLKEETVALHQRRGRLIVRCACPSCMTGRAIAYGGGGANNGAGNNTTGVFGGGGGGSGGACGADTIEIFYAGITALEFASL